MMKRLALSILCIPGLLVSSVAAADLQPGPVQLQSAGPLALTDTGVLLVGDPMAATIYAMDTESKASSKANPGLAIPDLKGTLAKTLGVDASTITVGDLVANEKTGTLFLTVSSGETTRIVSINSQGEASRLNLDKIPHAKKTLKNAPENKVTGEGRRQKNRRTESITDLAFFEGKVLVSGLSATDSPSTLMEIPYPFSDETILTNVELFHAAHGRVESDPAIRTFVTMMIDGKPNVLAGFTCTPLVAFPVNQLGSKEKVRGKTLAELGNRNQPLDMISYEKDGQKYLLISNSARGVMKVSLLDVESNPGLSEPVSGGGTAGQPYETIESLGAVKQLDKYSATHAVVISQGENDSLALRVAPLP
jgi:hypothetical protein